MRFLLSFLIWCLCCTSVFAGNESLIGTWANSGGSFTFNSNGTALIQWSNGTEFSGNWQHNGQLLSIITQSGQMQFIVSKQGETLFLQDNNGIYELRKKAGQKENTSVQTEKKKVDPLSDEEYIHFLETYPTMAPEEIYQYYLAMTDNQRLNIEIWQALGSDIYTRICKGGISNNQVWKFASGPVTCSQLIAWENQAVAMGNTGQEADLQRQQVITIMKCQTGQLSKEACQSYKSTVQSYNQGTIDTMKNTVDNMKSKPCTQYYDENGSYVGCW